MQNTKNIYEFNWEQIKRKGILVSKTRVKTWKAILIVLFVAGFASALTLAASQDLMEKGVAQEDKQPPKLQSIFFKDDLTTQSIMTGTDYQMHDENYFTSTGEIDTLSFEYKVINALRQLGYVRITFTVEPTDTPSTVGLHKFQKKHGLSASDFIDKNLMTILDPEVFQRENLDKNLAEKYPPYKTFIESPLNEPSKEHLAALYSSFFDAMPTKIYEPTWTIDEFRISLVAGLGGNLGKMMDPEGIRVLALDEAVQVMLDKGDFKFCGDAYYDKFKNNGCVNPHTLISTHPYEDFIYLTAFTHEYGHGAGSQTTTIESKTDRADNLFGAISFDMSVLINPGEPDSGSETLLRPEDNDGEFVSMYAKTNNKEDFAESFTAYVQAGNIFRERGIKNIYLKQKYEFLKKNIFYGREYKTGSITSVYLWELNHEGLPFHPWDYFIEDPDWVWDYEYWPSLLRGDINQDGKISAQDLILMEKFLKHGGEPTQEQRKLADLNANQKVDRFDWVALQKLLEGKIQQKDLPLLLGDVNQDKLVNSKDAVLIQKHLAGRLEFSESQKLSADANANKRIDEHDVKLIMNVSAQIIGQKDLPLELGDFDDNDQIKSNDVIKVMKYLNPKNKPTSLELLYGDMNLNGKFDQSDLDQIQKMATKYTIEPECLVPPVKPK